MYEKETPESIQALFDSIAKSYDRTNAILSFNMHRHWNRELLKLTAHTCSPAAFLDLCAGTGEIALNYVKQNNCQAYLLDFSEKMLSCASLKAKRWGIHPQKVTFLQADAQAIPLPDHSMECVTIAYGIRNVQNPQKCFEEVHRVLKPGGIFGILELTRPDNSLLKVSHQLYLRTLLPLLGKVFSANKEAYSYLSRSIQDFSQSKELGGNLEKIGFKNISYHPLTGGIATIIKTNK